MRIEKALLCIDSKTLNWISEMLHISSPLLLPILNKAYIHYWIDFCFLNNIKELRIVSDSDFNDLSTSLDTMHYADMHVSYQLSADPGNRSANLSKNLAFHEDAPLLYIEGFFFVHFDKEQRQDLDLGGSQMHCFGACAGGGLYGMVPAMKELFSSLASQQEGEKESFRCSPLRNVRDYFDLSTALCGEPMRHYALNSFVAGENIYVGTNVEIPLYIRFEPGVIVGSNVVLSAFNHLRKGTVIGDGCCVDEHTEFENCIVMPGTYVGAWLELRNKIISKRTIIDPINDIVMLSGDDLLSSELEAKRKMPLWDRLCNGFAALVLLVLYLPLFILLLPCRLCTLGTRLLRRFSLDFYPDYFRVLTGEYYMVGAPKNSTSSELPRGVFSYSQYLRHHNDPLLSDMDEYYYIHHKTVRLATKIVLKILFLSLIIPKEFRYDPAK